MHTQSSATMLSRAATEARMRPGSLS